MVEFFFWFSESLIWSLSNINKIYEDKGKYSLLWQLTRLTCDPCVVYSIKHMTLFKIDLSLELNFVM